MPPTCSSASTGPKATAACPPSMPATTANGCGGSPTGHCLWRSAARRWATAACATSPMPPVCSGVTIPTCNPRSDSTGLQARSCLPAQNDICSRSCSTSSPPNTRAGTPIRSRPKPITAADTKLRRATPSTVRKSFRPRISFPTVTPPTCRWPTATGIRPTGTNC